MNVLQDHRRHCAVLASATFVNIMTKRTHNRTQLISMIFDVEMPLQYGPLDNNRKCQ